MIRKVPFAEIDAHCTRRPTGYREELMAMRSGDWSGGIVIDSDSPAYRAMMVKYAAVRGPSVVRAVPVDWSVRGRALWDELHRRPSASEGNDAEWLEAFAKRLPCGECNRHWREWVQANPPPEPLSFEWTWRAHCAVNERLGKPSLSLDEAKRRWGYG